MKERDKISVERIAEEIRFIKSSTAKITREAFLRDSLLQHAICMSILTIGECANHFSDEFKALHSQIDWVQIIAVRNIAAHGYWQLNMEQIWQAVMEDIPPLEAFVQKL